MSTILMSRRVILAASTACAALLVAAHVTAAQETGTAGFAVQVVLERKHGSAWEAVDPHLVLNGGDEVRFRFKANRPGFLYVVNHDAQGRDTWLFPTPDTGEQNVIEAGKDYLIPSTGGVFEIANNPGYETTYWIISPEELHGRKTLDPAVKKDDETPLLPRCGDGPLIARGPCKDGLAGAHQFSSNMPPQWFEGESKLQSRDLQFDDKSGGSRVTLPAAFSAPFIYEFRIAHR